MNLSNLSLDVFDDTTLPKTMTKVASSIPSELRSQDLPTADERNKLDPSQFALCMITKEARQLNKFPIHDKLNVALSNEYFDLNHHKIPKEAQKIAATYIKLACEQYGIPCKYSVKVAAEKFPVMTNIFIERGNEQAGGSLAQEKLANDKDSKHYYALTKQAGDSVSNRSYAMPTLVEVKKAEAYFDKYAQEFSPEDRHQFADHVFQRAIELGGDITSKGIQKYAGVYYSPDLGAYLSSRRKLVENKPVFLEAFNKLASYQSSTDPKTFAKVLHELDKKAGLDKYYGKYLPDPYASTFSPGRTKTASLLYDKEGITLMDTDVEKCAVDKYEILKNYFGKTLADGLKKEGAPAFVSLPDDAKDVIARIANGEIQ